MRLNGFDFLSPELRLVSTKSQMRIGIRNESVLTSVTSMTLMAASCPVLVCRPCNKTRACKRHCQTRKGMTKRARHAGWRQLRDLIALFMPPLVYVIRPVFSPAILHQAVRERLEEREGRGGGGSPTKRCKTRAASADDAVFRVIPPRRPESRPGCGMVTMVTTRNQRRGARRGAAARQGLAASAPQPHVVPRSADLPLLPEK